MIVSVREAFAAPQRLWIVSPFVTLEGVRELLTTSRNGGVDDLKLVTRLYEGDFVSGASEVRGLIAFVEAGGTIRVHDRTLHAKAIITDDLAYVGSANLTGGGLMRNVELMYRAESQELTAWYESLWNDGSPITIERLLALDREIASHPARGSFEATRSAVFRDFASQMRVADSVPIPLSGPGFRKRRSLLKLNGYSGGPHRSDGSATFSHSIDAAGAQCFNRKPAVERGDVMYLCRLFRSAAGTPARAAYGRGVVDRVRLDEDVMPLNLFQGISNKPERIEKWSRIVWLRDVSVVNCRADQAPNPYDPRQFDRPLLLEETRQGSHFFPPEETMDEIDAALERAFSNYGKTSLEQPQQVWWNHYLPATLHLTRKFFEERNP